MIDKNKDHTAKSYWVGIQFSLIAMFPLLLFCLSCKGQVAKSGSAPPKSTKFAETNPSVGYADSTDINKYVDGEKEGLWRVYYDNGIRKSEGLYAKGLKEGLHKQWSSSGILQLEGFYNNGKANGLMKWFHEQGHLAAEGNMINDIREGPWKIYDIQQNDFCIEAFFEKGKREGVWRINHENARDKLWKEQTYKNDKLVSEKCRDIHGLIIACE